MYESSLSNAPSVQLCVCFLWIILGHLAFLSNWGLVYAIIKSVYLKIILRTFKLSTFVGESDHYYRFVQCPKLKLLKYHTEFSDCTKIAE